MRKRLISKFHVAYHLKRRFVVIFAILLMLLIYFFKNASIVLRVFSAIGFVVAFYALDHGFDIRFRKRHYAFIFIIAIASFLFSPAYYLYPNYDKIQHFIQPILVSSIVFYMISYLNIERKYRLLLAFMVTMGLLGMFEIAEYGLDYLFDLKLQGVYLREYSGLEKFNLLMDPLDDTMADLLIGIFGSGAYFLGHVFFGKRYYSKYKNPY
ncbi:MAG: hypothetical protein AABW79_00545 [Nanoarchaeota archaeon]